MRDSGAGPTVFVVDDDLASRREYAGIIEKQGWCVELYCRAEELLAAYGETPPPGCLLLDAELPGMGAMELQRHARQHEWTHQVIFLARRGTIATAVRAMRGGAMTFLESPVEAEVLVWWVRAAIAVDARLREQDACRNMLRSRLDLLSEREREVLQHVIAGESSKEIAAKLFLSSKTVQLHRARIMKKTGAVNAAELVSLVNSAEGLAVAASTRAIIEQVLMQL